MRWAVLAIGCMIGAVAAVALVVDLWVLGDDEVVTLATRTLDGETFETQLWVIDGEAIVAVGVEGSVWLRAHTAEAAWLARLRATPEVELHRNGSALPYRAVSDEGSSEQRDALNLAMREKYGVAERVVGWVFDSDEWVAVRLEPDPSRNARRLEAAHGAPD